MSDTQTVWLVYRYARGSDVLEGVFATEAAANKYLEEHASNWRDDGEVGPWEVQE